jgi:hypothetical protein
MTASTLSQDFFITASPENAWGPKSDIPARGAGISVLERNLDLRDQTPEGAWTGQ